MSGLSNRHSDLNPFLRQKIVLFSGLQHSHLLLTICTMHIHLDKHDCMEIIVLKGPVGEINQTAENILSQKGVKLGRVNLIAADGA